MAKVKKKTSRKQDKDSEPRTGEDKTTMPLIAPKGAIDSRLAALFAGSASSITTAPPKLRPEGARPLRKSKSSHDSTRDTAEKDSIQHSDRQELISSQAEVADDDADARSSPSKPEARAVINPPSRKRKRREENEGLEDTYMRRVVESERKEVERRRASKKAKNLEQGDVSHAAVQEDSDLDQLENTDEPENDESGDDYSDTAQGSVPQHESLNTITTNPEAEKSSRTVFLANVSISAINSKSAKKTLLSHLASFIPLLSANTSNNEEHKVESIRFRSTAFSSTSIPKKAAYARKELMDATTKSTNAYVVYSTATAAREAAKRLNGTVVLDRHLRVDSVAHPAKVDHRRCVFVGNLGFVDDESRLQAATEEDGNQTKKKKKEPGDVEEGLWRHFGEVGTVESVRVVRDPKTRVGKGFAYVQFVDPNSVEAALLYNDKKFPPLLPRKLRVTRAKRPAKKSASSGFELSGGRGKSHNDRESGNYVPKVSSDLQSFRGRAGRLLGRAGAAKLKRGGALGMLSGRTSKTNGEESNVVVFEGHRATSQSRLHGLKLGKGKSGGQKWGKPQTRSSRRAAAWKATKGKTTTTA